MTLAVLGTLLVLAAYLLSRAAGLRRTAEVVLGAWCIASALVLVAVVGLATAGALTKKSLVFATAGLVAAALGVARSVRGRSGILDDFRALRPRWPARRAAFAVPVALVVAYAIVASMLLPSESWDGIWYHDTIVGWTIQSRSLGAMELPKNLLQQANGFPRAAELTSTWLVLLSDRRTIELPNTIALVPLTFATYLVARRFTRQPAVAMALACIFGLAPGAILQLRSTYVDVFAAAACVASIHFATKRPLSARDAILAGVAAAIHLASKPTAITVAPLVIGFVLTRRRSSGRWAVGAAAALFSCSVALVYGRNAILFHNPVYPLEVSLPRFGVHWDGVENAGALDYNVGLVQTFSSVLSPAAPGRDFADIRIGGYGLAFAWVLLPLALAGIARAARDSFAKGVPPHGRARARWLLCTLALVVPSLVLSPALWSARYQLHAAALACAPAAYALDLVFLRRLLRVVIAAGFALACAAIPRFDPPLGGAPPSRLLGAIQWTAEQRACATEAEWTLDPDVACARERELGPGDVVAFGDGVTFPSVLYNEHFDNLLLYLPQQSVRDVDKAVSTAHPKWIVAKPGEPLYQYVEARPHRWRRIGMASRGQPTVAFRRY